VGSSEYVWALRDLDFEVKKGEVLGIIGRNGAGKSTLLKILSKTTTPSLGQIKIKGRVASLLEVGTGFHPDLSGRENIFLNGAILGMTKKEIKSKFDEIIDFAGVERYIDTPVKRYSSGMYVRLAFGVAAHLEPEILIVDEVLAVGDVEFQKKALGKMKDVSTNQGRTVLFVSHLMGSIAQLCDKGLLLNQGETVLFDNIGSVINKYLDMGQSGQLSKYMSKASDRNKEAFIHSMEIVNLNGENLDLLGTKDEIIIDIDIRIQRWHNELELGLSLQDRYGKRIFTIHHPLKGIISRDETEKIIQIEFPSNLVVPGKYSWIAAIHLPGSESIDAQFGICNFSVVDSGTQFAQYENVDYGYVFVNNYTVKVK
jgi:lipopolysaccharide transport system ATP-binding protein